MFSNPRCRVQLQRRYVEHVRLADQSVAGEACFVIESRTASHDRDFDRMESFISKRTGVGLRIVYYQRKTELRRVIVSPGNIVCGRSVAVAQ